MSKKYDLKSEFIGMRMADRTVFAGISPDTGRPMYAGRADALSPMTWSQARDYAATLNAYGHNDWRLPTRAELTLLFNSRAAIGGFNAHGSPAAWAFWWSADEQPGSPDRAWAQRFFARDSEWLGDWLHKDLYQLPLRCVRG